MPKRAARLLVIFIWVAALTAPLAYAAPVKDVAVIGNLRLQLEFSETQAERYQGLSGRQGLAPDEGMLFIFKQPGHYGFVMRNMNFPLDILWLDSNQKVVHIVQNAQPEAAQTLQTYRPDLPAQYVLEINAGLVAEYGISVDDQLQL